MRGRQAGRYGVRNPPGAAREDVEAIGHRVSRSQAAKGSVRAWLTHRHLAVGVGVLAMLLALPSLWAGWIADDHVLRIRLLGWAGHPEFTGSPLELFAFADGDPKRTAQLTDLGFWPWWTLKELRASFLRPLACLTHWLDLHLWPTHAILMHLQSLLWFGGLVAAVAMLYRRVMGPTVAAGLAALLFAIDDAHGTPVGFIANRNALLATFFGLLAVLAHDRWRRDPPAAGRAGAVAGPVLLVLSLLSAEFGVGTLAYLIAYAFFLDRGTWRARVTSLLPYGLVVLVWRVAWTCGGYGVFGTDLYVDPLAEPVRFAVSVLRRVPVLLLGQWAGLPSEISNFYSVCVSPILARLLWLAAVVVVTLFGMAMVPLLRRDAVARFWGAGMMLSLVPACATCPQDRMLLLAGVGAFGLLGQFLGDVFGRASDSAASGPRQGRPRWGRTFGVLFVLVHAVLAPIVLPFRAGMPLGPKSLMDQILVNTPMDSAVERQDVVLVNAPVALATVYVSILRTLDDQPVPRCTRALSASWSPVELSRPDERTLVVRPDWGYLSSPLDTLARGLGHPMHLGQRVELTGLTIEVTALTDDGRPAEATCRFAVPLEDPSLRWLRWKDGAFIPFVPPGVGETVRLPAAIPALRWQGWGLEARFGRKTKRALDRLRGSWQHGPVRPVSGAGREPGSILDT